MMNEKEKTFKLICELGNLKIKELLEDGSKESRKEINEIQKEIWKAHVVLEPIVIESDRFFSIKELENYDNEH